MFWLCPRPHILAKTEVFKRLWHRNIKVEAKFVPCARQMMAHIRW